MLIERVNLLINDSDDKLGTTSNIAFMLETHVYDVTHTFLILLSFLSNIFRTYTVQKLLTPVVEKVCVSTNWSFVNDDVLG